MDIKESGQSCKFRNCNHIKEPKCNVKNQVEEETLLSLDMIIIYSYLMKSLIERYDIKWLKVLPSLLSVDFLNLKEELDQLEKANVDGLHFDVMDGQFVPNISIGIPLLDAVKSYSNLPIDVHLMIEQPENI